VFLAFVQSGNDIKTEKDIYAALCRNGGLIGFIAILFDGSEVAADPSEIKKNVCVLSTPFKARTGVRETHEFQWTGEGAEVYTLSGQNTYPKHVSIPLRKIIRLCQSLGRIRPPNVQCLSRRTVKTFVNIVMSDDIEEAELEEARDLMEAEALDGDDPGEFLAFLPEQDAEKDGSE
jgi:hypothetical protein